MQKYWESLDQSGHKSSVGRSTVLVCTAVGACVGAIPTWNAGDDCMIPYGFIPVVAGIACGTIGLVIGLMAAPIAVYVEKERRDRTESRRGSIDTDSSANLLRPASQHESECLLLPASKPAMADSHLLLKSSELDRHQED